MKVTTTASFDGEVDVYIDIDDIVAAIREDTKSGVNGVLRSFSDFIGFWQAVPDDIYAEFNDKQRAIITEHLEKTLAKVKGVKLEDLREVTP